MDLQKTGRTIASLRRSQGYTQQTLAEKLGISDKAVSKWERGITCPDVSLWNKLSILLDTDIESLIYGHEGASEWKGVLILEEGINPEIIIYDKPLIHYLISQFLLIGIKEIGIVGGYLDLKIPGVSIKSIKIDEKLNRQFTSNVLFVYGNRFIYGPDLTKHFKRAMSRPDAPTIICSMRVEGEFPVTVDEEKKLHRRRTSSHYFAEPYVFYPDGTSVDETFEKVFDKKALNAELLARGMACFHVNNYEEAMRMAEYVRIMERITGEKIGCIEEILIRRGLAGYEDVIKDVDRETEEYLRHIFG